MRSTHGKNQLEGSGPDVPAGGDGNDVVIIVRKVAKGQVLCPKHVNNAQHTR
jgi:hypothetical protein